MYKMNFIIFYKYFIRFDKPLRTIINIIGNLLVYMSIYPN